MKISCNREQLLAAFQTAASVAPARSPKEILQNVKIEVTDSVVTLLATDLEVGIRIEVSQVDIEAAGKAVLPKVRFGQILQESSDEKLLLETDEQGIVVRGSSSEFKLPAQNPDEFPAVAEFTEEKFHEVPARLFREMIRRTIFSTDSESSRYALGGIKLEFDENKISAIATDGRRLAKMEGPAMSVGGHSGGEGMTIVPTRAMQTIEKALTDGDAEIQVAARANDVLIKSQRATIFSRLVEGRFPNWQEVFPRWDNPVAIEMTVGPLMAVVRQAAIVTSEESRGVDFSFGDGKLLLAGQTAEIGQSRVELPIAYDGPTIAVKLDPRYVTDFLRVLSPEKTFKLEIRDSESAALFSTDDGYGYVVMPLARDR